MRVDPPEQTRRNPAVDDDVIVGEVSREHLAVPGQPGEQAAVSRTRADVDVAKRPTEAVAHRPGECRQAPVRADTGIACG